LLWLCKHNTSIPAIFFSTFKLVDNGRRWATDGLTDGARALSLSQNFNQPFKKTKKILSNSFSSTKEITKNKSWPNNGAGWPPAFGGEGRGRKSHRFFRGDIRYFSLNFFFALTFG
jgi:hypothetical protein